MAVRYLRISVTDRCDLRCAYCVPVRTAVRARREALLRFEEIATVARIAASMGVEKVRVTGGEPLSRPGIARLLGELASIDGLADRGITTNGRRLAEFVPLLARTGYRANVHLDTVDPDRYRGRCGAGSPAIVQSAIETAIAAGIQVKINAVCTADADVDDALRLARWGLERGADVRFIEAMPVRGAGTDAGARAAIARVADALVRMLALRPEGMDGVAQVWRTPGARARVGFITPSHAPFCAGCDKLRLSSRGCLRTCLFAEGGADLRALLRAGDEAGLREAVAAAMTRKAADAGREGCRIRTMVGIGG